MMSGDQITGMPRTASVQPLNWLSSSSAGGRRPRLSAGSGGNARNRPGDLALIAAFLLTSGLMLKFASAAPGNEKPRSLAADAIAGRLASQAEAQAGSSETAELEKRLDFAAGLGAFLPEAKIELVQTASLADETAPKPFADTDGMFIVRDLPQESSLSAGRKISKTAWAFAKGDLDGLSISLPGTKRRIRARIEILGQSGWPRGSATIEIKSSDLVRLSQPFDAAKSSVRRRAPPKAPKSLAATTTQTLSAQPPTPAKPESAASGLFVPAGEVPTPQSDDGAGKQTLINLGVFPRSPMEEELSRRK